MDRKEAAEQLLKEIGAIARRLPDARVEGRFDKTDKRKIKSLDTKDETIRLNGFVFRRRHDIEKSKTNDTLKFRSLHRYVSASADVKVGEGADSEE